MRLTGVMVPALALALGGLSAFALAQEQGPASPDEAAVEAICGGPPPCTAVNGLANPSSAGADGEVMQFQHAIATRGRPASACPEATAAYEAAGVHVDAFIGPCPDPDDPSARIGASPFGRDEMIREGGR